MDRKSFISCMLAAGIVLNTGLVYGEQLDPGSSREDSGLKIKVQESLSGYNSQFAKLSKDSAIGYNKISREPERVRVDRVVAKLSRNAQLPVERKFLQYSSKFGKRGNVFSREVNMENIGMHTGLDIAAANIENQKVFSILDGRVIKAQLGNTGYGNYVIVDHGDFTSYYAHLNKIDSDIREGQDIKAGDLIGLVGSTGRSTGPHLHLEINIGNTALNPEIFMPYIVGTEKIIAEKPENKASEKIEKKQEEKSQPSSRPSPKEERAADRPTIELMLEAPEPKKPSRPEPAKKADGEAYAFKFSSIDEAYSFDFDFQK